MRRNQTLALAVAIGVSLTSATLAQAATLTGKVSTGKGSVVYVEAVPGKTFAPSDEPITIDQDRLTFKPHVAVVPVGSTVNFVNKDRVAHNIFWPGISGNKKQAYNLGTWPTGETRSYKFAVPGVVPLLCNVHAEMSAYVVVVPTPYYAITDESGSYSLADLPEGEYKVSAWHEGMKVATKPVSVAKSTTLDFALSK